MKVFFNSKEEARSLLTSTAFLAKNNLKAKSDQTPYQLKYLRDRRLELDANTEKGEKNLTIKYVRGTPKIVSNGNVQARDTSIGGKKLPD